MITNAFGNANLLPQFLELIDRITKSNLLQEGFGWQPQFFGIQWQGTTSSSDVRVEITWGVRGPLCSNLEEMSIIVPMHFEMLFLQIICGIGVFISTLEYQLLEYYPITYILFLFLFSSVLSCMILQHVQCPRMLQVFRHHPLTDRFTLEIWERDSYYCTATVNYV